MRAVLPGLPTSDASPCLQGSDTSTQAAISAGQYSYPIDALGAYIISADPRLVCGPQHWKKSSSGIRAPVLSAASPFTSHFLRQLAFRRALSAKGRLAVPLRVLAAAPAAPRGQGLQEFPRRCRLLGARQSEFNLLIEIQSMDFLGISAPLRASSAAAGAGCAACTAFTQVFQV